MPSRPSLQAWAKTVGPSPSKRIAPQVVAVQLDEVEGVTHADVTLDAVALDTVVGLRDPNLASGTTNLAA